MQQKQEKNSHEILLEYLRTQYEMFNTAKTKENPAFITPTFEDFLNYYSRQHRPFQLSIGTNDHPEKMSWEEKSKVKFLRQFNNDKKKLHGLKLKFPIAPQDQHKTIEKVVEKYKKITEPLATILSNVLVGDNNGQIINSLRRAYIFSLISDIYRSYKVMKKEAEKDKKEKEAERVKKEEPKETRKQKQKRLTRDFCDRIAKVMFNKDVYQAYHDGFIKFVDYSLELKADNSVIEKNKLYLELHDDSFTYTLRTPSGEIITPEPITYKELDADLKAPVDLDQLIPLLPKIIQITATRGHSLDLRNPKAVQYESFTKIYAMDSKAGLDFLEQDINGDNLLNFCYKLSIDKNSVTPQFDTLQKEEILRTLCRIPYLGQETKPVDYIKILKNYAANKKFEPDFTIDDIVNMLEESRVQVKKEIIEKQGEAFKNIEDKEPMPTMDKTKKVGFLAVKAIALKEAGERHSSQSDEQFRLFKESRNVTKNKIEKKEPDSDSSTDSEPGNLNP